MKEFDFKRYKGKMLLIDIGNKKSSYGIIDLEKKGSDGILHLITQDEKFKSLQKPMEDLQKWIKLRSVPYDFPVAIKYFQKEKEKIDDLKNIRGKTFIGNDGNHYTAISYNEKTDKISIIDNNNKEYVSTLYFIKEFTKETPNKKAFLIRDIFKSMTDFNKSSIIEKIKTGLFAAYSNFDETRNDYFKPLKVLGISKGEAYYHEVDINYILIGLELEYEFKYEKIMDKVETSTGFFTICIPKNTIIQGSGRCQQSKKIKFEDYFPIDFTEGRGIFGSYCNGFGDDIDIVEKLIHPEALKLFNIDEKTLSELFKHYTIEPGNLNN